MVTNELGPLTEGLAAVGDYSALRELGLLAERRGHADQARAWYLRAYQAGNVAVALDLGRMAHAANDADGARDWFATAVKHYDDSSSQPFRAALKPLMLYFAAVEAYRRSETGLDAALEQAVLYNRWAAQALSDNHPAQDLILADLRDVLKERHTRHGRIDDLEEAAAVARTAWHAVSPSSLRLRADAAWSAISLWQKLAEVTGDPRALMAALHPARRTVERCDPAAVERARLQATLCGALMYLAEHTDADVSIDEAVQRGEESVERLPPTNSVSRINLGSALLLRGRQRGSTADLDRSVRLLSEALALDDVSVHSAAALNLASALTIRADITGRSEDKRRARAAARRAWAAADPAAAGPSQSPLSITRALENASDPDAFRLALRTLSPEHSMRTIVLGRLAETLSEAGEHEAALKAAREAVITARGRSVALDARRVLGRLLLISPTDDTAGKAAAEEAVTVFRAAAEACEPSDTRYAEVMIGLAGALFALSTHDPGRCDRTLAMTALRNAARAESSPVRDRLLAAQVWSGEAWGAGDIEDALAGAQCAVSLLQEFGWIGLDRSDQESGLREGRAMPRDAAAIAISAGRPELAVELLEQGHSVLWHSAMLLRGEFASLADDDPALAAQLEEVAAVLRAGDRLDPESHLELARRWKELLGKARKHSEKATFLLPSTYDTLAPAAADGPVVIVNISSIRCDALIVPPSGEVDVVHLPEVTVPRMDALANRYLTDLAEAEDSSAPFPIRDQARHTLHDTLEWLWDHIASPVLARLPKRPADGPLPRVWWCPTASLVALPLHAAGRYPRHGNDPREPVGVPYEVVSSYTTTLASLILARTKQRPSAPESRLLAVGLTDVGRGHRPLSGVATELEALTQLVGHRLTVLGEQAATVDAVRSHLPGHTWAHFACHGRFDMLAPLSAGLCLSDGDMSIRDFADLHLTDADLAFLSACHTYVGSNLLPDEAIHTAAALRAAGFRHVVASMWAIHDNVAPMVAAAFYERVLTAKGLSSSGAATALHEAVSALRDAHLTDPTVWAHFLHNGP